MLCLPFEIVCINPESSGMIIWFFVSLVVLVGLWALRNLIPAMSNGQIKKDNQTYSPLRELTVLGVVFLIIFIVVFIQT